MPRPTVITPESFVETVKDMPNACVVMLYSLSRYHEKYIFTSWVQKELAARGFKNFDLQQFDSQFSEFYDMLLKQDDL